MILEEIKGGSLLAPVPDDHGGAPDNLPLVTLGIQLAKASVLAGCLAQSIKFDVSNKEAQTPNETNKHH